MLELAFTSPIAIEFARAIAQRVADRLSFHARIERSWQTLVDEHDDLLVRSIDEQFAMRVADAYESGTHDPANPLVRESYRCFTDTTVRQFKRAVEDDRIRVLPWLHDGQPYRNSEELFDDITRRRRIYYFRGGELPPNHPLAEIAPITASDDTPMNHNEVFRVVHDYFGHAVGHYQFGPLGEELAFRSHRRTYPKPAMLALANETRFQAMWTNFGPHMRTREGTMLRPEDGGYIALHRRPYPAQKACIMPDWCSLW